MEPTTAAFGLGLIWILFILGVSAVALAATVFWIIEIADAAQRQFNEPNLKIVWLLVIIFGHFIGALVYYFAGKQQGVIITGPVQSTVSAQYDHLPVTSFHAKVTAKRTGMSPLRSINTLHYATFEDANGDRQELSLTGPQYGLIAEGDYGLLHSQGSRFLSFVREPSPAA